MRTAIQSELADAAQELFLEQGYDAVTVGQIATKVGMSRRSFFRYFGSKDDLIIGKYGLWVDDMVDSLRSRPVGEAPWASLRATFDTILDYYADSDRRDRVAALQNIIDASPGLHAQSLAVLENLQGRLRELLLERAAETTAANLDESRARAIVGAAWACLQAALPQAYSPDPDAFRQRLDQLMDEFGPRLDR
ncbi:hypothetical protein AX769_01515 [Frondihabitans sp. PAMC 28766]|uniref:TetR/AcrR family transcriptional regulator n=1 Tax=Frondihabitans sp. PAMC 28766 TaxID=1795630 RepID=UPI00078DBB45|nr:TetR/AcrR family transcriptional regulator [Frondihabitans sp. PAMC 28766]AMM19058.1 hypothetical protein AX769_01515 [Frondihabitans sp. PAMC 28766]